MFILQGAGLSIEIITVWYHFLTRSCKNNFTSLFNIHIIAGTWWTAKKVKLWAVRDRTVFGKLASLGSKIIDSIRLWCKPEIWMLCQGRLTEKSINFKAFHFDAATYLAERSTTLLIFWQDTEYCPLFGPLALKWIRSGWRWNIFFANRTATKGTCAEVHL